MTKLEQLIKELCPNGVEYRKVGDICEVLTGGEPPERSIKSQVPQGEFIYPIYSNGIGENALWGYSSDYRIDREAVTFSSIGTIGCPTLRESKFTPIIRLKVLIPLNEKELNIRFLKYALEVVDFTQQKSSVPNVNANMIKAIQIPLPPLAVQREIVRILDKFTLYSQELVAELVAELAARRMQYEYYRDRLLSQNVNSNIQMVRLGDICQVYDGTHQTPKYTNSGIKFVSVENINDLYASQKFISISDYENNYKIKPKIDDVLMTRIGVIGKCAIVDKAEPLAYYVSLALLRPNTNKIFSKFLKYFIESNIGQKELRRLTLVNAVPIKVNMGDISKVKISLPPLDIQERIVKVLDNFDAICSDFGIGLPAEMEKRQKQYEYYRDKLLTFEEIAQ